MDAEKCRILLNALDCGSISTAANGLGYTASGISKAISSLENEIGFPLLVRSHEGVAPTTECELLLPLLRELAFTMDKLEQTASGIRGLDIGTLAVGSSYSVYDRWLTEKIAEFFADRPGIKVLAYNDVSSRLKAALDEHRLDVAIMSRREGNYDWIHLKWDQMVVLVSRDHPFAARDRFPLRSLESEPYIEIYPDSETDNSRMLEKNHISPHVRFCCADGASAVPFVEKGLGVCVVNELIAVGLSGNITALPIYPQQLVDIGIAIPTMQATSPIIRSFTDYLVQCADEII